MGRELKFRVKTKRLSPLRLWRKVESLHTDRSVQGGSTDYGRHIKSNGKVLYGRDHVLQQLVDGKWETVELNDLQFVTLNPKDGEETGVTAIPTDSKSPLHVHFYSYFELECADKSKPNMRSSCDGRAPIGELDIWQVVDGERIAVT